MIGSAGERRLQDRYGTAKRACHFYENQVTEVLNPQMRHFISRMEMVLVSTADANGECDCSLRAGPPGFVRVLSGERLVYPEYRGNGVMASLGNITENPHIGLLFLDFSGDTVGLHVNGRARLVEHEGLLSDSQIPSGALAGLMAANANGTRSERWVVVDVDEAYIHCSRHIPRLVKAGNWLPRGIRETVGKKADYFGTIAAARSARKETLSPDAGKALVPAAAEAASPAAGKPDKASSSFPRRVRETVGKKIDYFGTIAAARSARKDTLSPAAGKQDVA